MASGDFTIKPLVLDEYKVNYHYITDQYIDKESKRLGCTSRESNPEPPHGKRRFYH